MTVSAQNLVWIDMEMTGWTRTERGSGDCHHHHRQDLNVLAQGPVIAIHQSDEELAKMDGSGTSTPHHKSGLVARVKASRR